jgi:hypothetical protein
MAHDLFVEEGGYFCFGHVDKNNDGSWRAWVNFERKSDHNAMLERIPGYRHALKKSFATAEEAAMACGVYAHQVIEAGDVGL